MKVPPHSKFLLLLAVVFTAVNCLKPLHVDDAAYYYYASQIAGHPLDPYGFEIFWYQEPMPANHVLAPPVLPYWWAAGIALFGERPYWWKVWLLPFSLTFMFALGALFRRFARGLELPLVTMTVLSPIFFPSLNLMLDVPALALSLWSIVLFLRGYERQSKVVVALAGIVAGLAMQTKYTAFLAPVVMIFYAGMHEMLTRSRSWRQVLGGLCLAFLSTAIAVVIFVSWEFYVAYRYGASHFLSEYQSQERNLVDQISTWALPLLALLGGLTPLTGVLAFSALRRRKWVIATTLMAILPAYALVVFDDAGMQVEALAKAGAREVGLTIVEPWSVEQVAFLPLGTMVALPIVAVLWRLLRIGRGALWRPHLWKQHRDEWFLASWLMTELAGYFAMTPFGAARRIMGLVVVGTLVIGRLASWTCRSPGRIKLIWSIALGNAILGTAFVAVDFLDANARKTAAEAAAAAIRRRDPFATIWYVGHWGFQFYAEHTGMRPVVPSSRNSPSERATTFHEGDWLVVPDLRLVQQELDLDLSRVQQVDVIEVGDSIPLRTLQCFYGTGNGVPLEHQDGPRISITIYRVTAGFVARGPLS